MDCQRGVLHHPIMLCPPGGVRGRCLCFVHPQVAIHLCGLLVGPEVHCCVDHAAGFLEETVL